MGRGGDWGARRGKERKGSRLDSTRRVNLILKLQRTLGQARYSIRFRDLAPLQLSLFFNLLTLLCSTLDSRCSRFQAKNSSTR